MTDVYGPEKRSAVMRAVKAKGTTPELKVRRALTALGARYRLHRKDLPGKPDIVLPGRRLAIFVHGCFWHGHDCPMFRLPATRADFWQAKIEANRARDARAAEALAAATWRRLTVWECALRGPARRTALETLDACECFLTGSASSSELTGRWKAGEGQ